MRAANTPPYHQRCRLTKWALITSWMVPLFSSEDMRSDLDPDYRTVSGHFNWALAHRSFWIMRGWHSKLCLHWWRDRNTPCFLTQCCFRANDHGHPCPFHTEIFPDTLNLSITSCTADDEIFNVFAFSHYSEIVPQFVDTLFCRLVNLLWEIQSV